MILLTTGVVLAASNQDPEQLHLAYTGDPTSMSIAWYSKDKMDAPVVEYGPRSGPATPLTQTAVPGSDQPVQYLKNYGYHYEAIMNGLTSAAAYSYRIGNANTSDTWTAVYSFQAAPGVDDSFSVSMYGDMGWLGSHERPMIVTVDGLEKNWTAVPSRAVIENLKNKGEIDFVP